MLYIIVGIFLIAMYNLAMGLSLLWTVFLTLLCLPFAIIRSRRIRAQGKAPDQIIRKTLELCEQQHNSLAEKTKLLLADADAACGENAAAHSNLDKAMNSYFEDKHFGSHEQKAVDENGIPYL